MPIRPGVVDWGSVWGGSPSWQFQTRRVWVIDELLYHHTWLQNRKSQLHGKSSGHRLERTHVWFPRCRCLPDILFHGKIPCSAIPCLRATLCFVLWFSCQAWPWLCGQKGHRSRKVKILGRIPKNQRSRSVSPLIGCWFTARPPSETQLDLDWALK